MRLAVCALSAVLLSGCSWLGMGGHNAGHGQAGGAYGVNCVSTGGGYYNGGAYGAGGACGVGGGYGVAGNGYGGAAGAYGQGAGYGQAGAGYGAGGAYGQGAGYGAGAGMVGAGLAANGVGGAYGMNSAYGASAGTTVLGANAPYGAAAYGQNVVGTSYSNGQYVQGAGVQTIQGAPIYVPQPYAQYYGVPQLRGMGGCGAGPCGGAMPFGVGLNAGTDFDIGGDIFTAKDPGLALGSTTVNTGGSEGISYDEAFGQTKSIGGTLGYDLSRNTTVYGGVNYATANGQTAEAYQSVDARSPGVLEDIDAEFSDLDLFTIEGGVRQYVGANPAFRPYVGASGGFRHNNDVTIERSYSSDGVAYDPAPFEYVTSGWNPTAAAVIGAEMAVGHRGAIGIESGIRWSDDMDTLAESEDRWSIPVSLRGRVAF